MGGSIAHADAAAEYPAVALALDAEVDATSPRGTRTIAAADLFTGVWTTALEPDEVLVGLRFPVWSGRCGFAIEEFARRHGDFAIAGAAVAVEIGEDDRVRRCGIGLIGLGSTPIRATAAEARGRRSTDRRGDRRRARPARSRSHSTTCPPTSTGRRRTARASAPPWSRGHGTRGRNGGTSNG